MRMMMLGVLGNILLFASCSMGHAHTQGRQVYLLDDAWKFCGGSGGPGRNCLSPFILWCGVTMGVTMSVLV